MRILVTGLIVLSLAAAGGTALLVKQFLESERQNQVDVPEPQEIEETASLFVLTVNNDLSAGTTVSGSNLRWHAWPEDMIQSTFVISQEKNKALLEEYVGAVVRTKILAGTAITPNMVFHRSDAGFLPGILTPGMRAVSIGIVPEQGAAGFILPGDHIDVILIHDVRKSYPDDSPVMNGQIVRYAAETILTDIRVLAVDQEYEDVGDEAVIAKTITLELSPKGAEVLSLAKEMGEIYLSLRSFAVEEPTGERTFTSDYEISQSLSASLGEGTRLTQPLEAQIGQQPQTVRQRARGIKVYRGVKETIRELPN